MSLPVEATVALLSLYDRDGCLTPVSVVSEAADPGSPLHEFFTWDDDVAAQQYRLIQAGKLIKRVRVQITPTNSGGGEGKAVRVVRAFHNVAPVTEPAEYHSISRIAEDPRLEAAAEARARNELKRVRKRYEDLRSLVDVVREVFGMEEAS